MRGVPSGHRRERGGRCGHPLDCEYVPLSAPRLGGQLPDAVPPPEPATTQRRGVAMESEWDRVTPQLFGMSPSSLRTPPLARCQSNRLVRQRCPPVFPPTLFVLVSAQILHRFPLRSLPEGSAQPHRQPYGGFIEVQVTSPRPYRHICATSGVGQWLGCV